MESIDSLLPGFLRRLASDEIRLIFIVHLWPEMVGKELAANSHPLALKDKRLVVAVPSEIWKRELLDMREMLIGAINGYWKTRLVERIDLRVRLMNDR